MPFENAHTEQLYHDLRRANSEAAKKERFLQYLTNSFANDPVAQKIISAMSLGAERTIANIVRGNVISSGRADTQTETVIIEWEKELTKTGGHAIEQLEEYLSGNWRSGQEYRYVLIATDGLKWRIYAPDWSHLKMGEFNLGRNFTLREIRKFDLTPQNVDEFPFFLDEILFVSQEKIATLDNIQNDFGDTSRTFINSMRVLMQCAQSIATKTELSVAMDQWRRFLSIAYGRFDDSPEMFLVHTYLSVFAKFIAYSVITKKHINDEITIKNVLNGVAFQKLNVERFVEDDFFHWVGTDSYFHDLKPMFRELGRQIAEYDFSDVQEDILKGVYQELIDLDTRHALGEYYTPDWLCEEMVQALPIEADTKVLDPACGSGSFLRAVAAQIRRVGPDIPADKIAEQVVGIDIHPLSVQIAKTTMLLALGKLVKTAKAPVTLHIYLANSLLVPEETADLFKSTFKITVDNVMYSLNIEGLTSPEDFDRVITICDDLVNRYPELLARGKFASLCQGALPPKHSVTLVEELYEIYKGMWTARDEGRDSIWKFILQNSYKPVFLRRRFDIVVGNPPWLTYSDVSNADYQGMLRILADKYGVTPERQVNLPHIEIAAIFLAHSANYFLKNTGCVAFVLPRSFMTADQHDNTRGGLVKDLQLSKIWDLKDVEPLFNVPACVFFARVGSHDMDKRQIPAAGLDGLAIEGRLKRSQVHLAEAKPYIKHIRTKWFYSRLQGGGRKVTSAITRTAFSGLVGKNPYSEHFKQGASIVPRSFYFIDIDGADSGELSDRIHSVTTSESILRDAKAPWKDIKFAGRAEGRFFFRTAIAKNILPFAVINPLLVMLPVAIEEHGERRKFTLKTHEQLLAMGARYVSKWFWEADERWEENKTEKAGRSGMTMLDRIDFQHGIVDQNPDARYLVVFCRSAQDGNAAVIDTHNFDRPFVVDFATYWYEAKTAAEAHYLAAFLNSGYANEILKEFQTRGLFGPRDVTKKILDIPLPRFDRKVTEHARIAELGRDAASIALRIANVDPDADLDVRSLGRMRSHIREEIEEELEEIDSLLKQISSSGTKSNKSSLIKKRGRKKAKTSGLFD